MEAAGTLWTHDITRVLVPVCVFPTRSVSNTVDHIFNVSTRLASSSSSSLVLEPGFRGNLPFNHHYRSSVVSAQLREIKHNPDVWHRLFLWKSLTSCHEQASFFFLLESLNNLKIKKKIHIHISWNVTRNYKGLLNWIYL